MSESRVRYPELSIVRLGRPIEAEGRVMPAGSSGVVVHVYPRNLAYEVEFTRPFAAVVTLAAEVLECR